MPRRRRQNGQTSYELGVTVVTVESSGVEIVDPLHDALMEISSLGGGVDRFLAVSKGASGLLVKKGHLQGSGGVR